MVIFDKLIVCHLTHGKVLCQGFHITALLPVYQMKVHSPHFVSLYNAESVKHNSFNHEIQNLV